MNNSMDLAGTTTLTTDTSVRVCHRLIIAGAGDFARELLWQAADIPANQRDWEPYGFLDDKPEEAAARLRGYGINLPVLGRISEYHPAPEERFVCAIASPKAKVAICAALRERGAQFVNIIHPTAAVAPSAQLGEGIVLCRHAIVSVNVRLGDFVMMNNLSFAGHDAVLEEGCTLSNFCDVTGHVHLHRGVFLGSHASVLPGTVVEEFATVGAGSVVVKRVQAGQTVIGVPARNISGGDASDGRGDRRAEPTVQLAEGTGAEAKLRALFAEVLGLHPVEVYDELTPDQVEQWDSVQHLNLMVTLEETYDLSLTPDEMNEMRKTFGTIKQVLQTKGLAL